MTRRGERRSAGWAGSRGTACPVAAQVSNQRTSGHGDHLTAVAGMAARGLAARATGGPRRRNGINVVLLTQQDATERMTPGCA